MRCALNLNQKITADYILNLINKTISDYAKENEDLKDSIMVIDIVKIKNEATIPQEL